MLAALSSTWMCLAHYTRKSCFLWKDGPQKSLVDFYGDQMQVTIYKISHHGASYLANKPISRDAHVPKATFVSGNPWYSYQHPRCAVTDGFIK